MIECPVCLEQFLWADPEALACHMILRHQTTKVDPLLGIFGCEQLDGYVFCFCGKLMSLDYQWPSAHALAEASEKMVDHWEGRGGLFAHYYRHLLGVHDGEEEGTL